MANLRDQAAADNLAIVEDAADGFGKAVTVTDPDGNTADLVGLWTDVEFKIDPDTGLSIAARTASVTLRIDSLAAAGLGMPEGQPDAALKPWRVSFVGLDGVTRNYKVSTRFPDAAIGSVSCMLEDYTPS
jgi:hypothetical protein